MQEINIVSWPAEKRGTGWVGDGRSETFHYTSLHCFDWF